MVIKPRIANTPVTDAQGYCEATLADITETVYSDPKSGDETEQFLFDFITEGKTKPIVLKIWTGLTVSPEKQDFTSKKTGDYSKLTKLILNLKVLTLEDLEDPEKVETIGEKLEALKGSKVRFKLTKAKGNGLSKIDLDSLELVSK